MDLDTFQSKVLGHGKTIRVRIFFIDLIVVTGGTNLRVDSMRRKLRSQAYKGLCYWLAASRSACGLTKFQDVLFTQLISDIVTHRDTVQLQTGTCRNHINE